MLTRLRRIISGVLIALAAVLIPSAIVAEYVRTTTLDTDRYVRTMSELADDPVIQDGVSDRVTEWIVGTPQGSSIPEPLVREGVSALVGSERFQDLWWRANRAAHPAAVALLTGDTTVVRLDEQGTVSIPLDAIIAEVRDELVEREVVGAGLIPDVSPDADVSIVLFEAPELGTAQTVLRILDSLAPLLTGAGAVSLIGALLIAPRGTRRRVVGQLGFGVILISATLLIVGLLVRRIYLQDISGDSPLSPDVATAALDVIVGPLVFDLWLAIAIGVLAIVVSWLTGLVLRSRRDGVPEPEPEPEPLTSPAADRADVPEE